MHIKLPTTHNITYQTTYTQNIHHIIHKATTNTPNHNHTKIPTIHIINHFTPLFELPLLYISINTISHIGNIYYTTHLHLKNSKNKLIQYYTWNNITLIPLSGDIHPNPGPITNILKHLPKEYIQRQKQYFLPNTLALKHQYIHLEKLFEPHLTPATSSFQNHELPHLRTHSLLLSHYPPHHLRYALIIVYSPFPQICNQLMTTHLDPIYLTILRRLQDLPNDTLLTTSHYSPSNISITTIAQAYSNINDKIAKGIPINPTTLKNDLPYLPTKIIHE